jgi:hypothetical protein
MEKKTEEEREKETRWKVRLSEKGYLKNGGMKEKEKCWRSQRRKEVN